MANIYPNSITTLPTHGLWHQRYHTHQHSPAAHQEHNLCKESLLCWQPQWYTALFHYRPDLNSCLFCSAQIWIIRILHTTGRMLHLQTLRTEAIFYFTPALFPSKLRSSLKKEFLSLVSDSVPQTQAVCQKHIQTYRTVKKGAIYTCMHSAAYEKCCCNSPVQTPSVTHPVGWLGKSCSGL